MKLKELFSRLSYGELSNLAIGMEGAGDIRQEDKMKVLSHVNDALLAIYSRFILSTKYLLVEQVDHITNYHLIPKYAESQNCVDYPYIKDLAGEEFTGDLIRILEVHRDNGCEYVLNDKDNPHSLFTPYPQTLQVPFPITGVPMHLMYQARHDPITEPLDDACIEVPFVLESALQAYVAHKIFSHMNGQDNMVKSQDHLATYEGKCMEVEAKDLVSTTFATSFPGVLS